MTVVLGVLSRVLGVTMRVVVFIANLDGCGVAHREQTKTTISISYVIMTVWF
jgi:hypothetical protein